MSDNRYSNRNAKIKNYRMWNGWRTHTAGRDDGSLEVSAVTYDNGRSTLKLYDRHGFSHALTGREMRTIYRTILKHYCETGKSL